MHGPLLQGPLNRRQFIHLGAIGTMLSLPRLLHASANTGSASSRRSTEPSCIFIVQQGGMSHIDTWDMKPLAPVEYRGPLKPIPTAVPGYQVCELMPQLA